MGKKTREAVCGVNCRIAELRNKDVISIKDGTRLGYVCDVEVDTCSARVCAIVIYGKPKLLGLFGREDDCVIEWSEIEVIGPDTILVSCCGCEPKRRRFDKHRSGFLDNLIGAHRGDT